MEKRALLEYISEAIQIERECYTLSETLDSHSMRLIPLKDIPQPTNFSISKIKDAPQKPILKRYSSEDALQKTWSSWIDAIFSEGLGWAVLWLLPISFILFSALIRSSFSFKTFLLVHIAICLLFFAGVFLFLWYKESKKLSQYIRRRNEFENQEYERKVRQREEQMSRYEQEMMSRMCKHDKEVEKIVEFNSTTKVRNKAITAARDITEDALGVFKETREQLYAANIIYPKYRNIIALTSFYEYFDSGRCDSLQGANGAYNMFELEVRMDRIIDKLDVINRNLGAIAQNQMLLYNEISKANKRTDEIISYLGEGFEQLAGNQAAIAAYTQKGFAGLQNYISGLYAMNAQTQRYIARLK